MLGAGAGGSSRRPSERPVVVGRSAVSSGCVHGATEDEVRGVLAGTCQARGSARARFRENGFVVVSGTWRGIVGPAGLPAPVQQRLGAALAQVMQSAALKQVLDEMNVEIDFRSGPDLLALMRQDEATIRALRLPS
jgi:hypothetical protein